MDSRMDILDKSQALRDRSEIRISNWIRNKLPKSEHSSANTNVWNDPCKVLPNHNQTLRNRRKVNHQNIAESLGSMAPTPLTTDQDPGKDAPARNGAEDEPMLYSYETSNRFEVLPITPCEPKTRSIATPRHFIKLHAEESRRRHEYTLLLHATLHPASVRKSKINTWRD